MSNLHIPCIDCICLPMCKQRFLSSLIAKLAHDCIMLDTFLTDKVDKNSYSAKNLSIVYHFFKGMI